MFTLKVSALFEKTERVVAGKCCSFLIKTIALINAKTFSPSGILPILQSYFRMYFFVSRNQSWKNSFNFCS